MAQTSLQRPAVHVDTIRNTYQGKVYEQHLLRSSYREGARSSTGAGGDAAGHFKMGGLDSQEEPTFERITTPTLLQQRAFDLLGVALK